MSRVIVSSIGTSLLKKGNPVEKHWYAPGDRRHRPGVRRTKNVI
ncbi:MULTISPECIES: hypothetical protein [unclassified Synechocystis]|nr:MULTISPECIES: hypothetical protein [unclassified Synechocystis]AIE73558.1 hypothetical protein D082_10300 [Synechocystis sp. PCC 6714]